jgi:hypothetical protein
MCCIVQRYSVPGSSGHALSAECTVQLLNIALSRAVLMRQVCYATLRYEVGSILSFSLLEIRIHFIPESASN